MAEPEQAAKARRRPAVGPRARLGVGRVHELALTPGRPSERHTAPQGEPTEAEVRVAIEEAKIIDRCASAGELGRIPLRRGSDE